MITSDSSMKIIERLEAIPKQDRSLYDTLELVAAYQEQAVLGDEFAEFLPENQRGVNEPMIRHALQLLMEVKEQGQDNSDWVFSMAMVLQEMKGREKEALDYAIRFREIGQDRDIADDLISNIQENIRSSVDANKDGILLFAADGTTTNIPMIEGKSAQESLAIQIRKWAKAHQFSKIIDTLESIPKGERSYTQTMQLATAYRKQALAGDQGPKSQAGKKAADDQMLQHAIDLLLQVDYQGASDPRWNRAMTKTLLSFNDRMDHMVRALDYAESWQALAPDDQEAAKLVQQIEAALLNP